MQSRKENQGVFLALITACISALFPILVSMGVKNIPPFTFAALSCLLAAGMIFIYMLARGQLHELKERKAYQGLLIVALCIIAIPYTLLFAGAKLTSGVNTALLALAEIPFTLIFTHFIGEKTSWLKILGGGGIFAGAALLTFRPHTIFNIGDLLIVLSTVLYPIGNFYAKKTFNLVSPSTVLFSRFLLGGLFLLILAMATEPGGIHIGLKHWHVLALNGLLVFGIGKILWYEAFKRLDISKAISLIMVYPLISLIILLIIFHAHVSNLQIVGIICMIAGLGFSIMRKSVDPKLTKYSPEFE